MPVQVLADFEKAFGCPILEGYGLSESSPAAAFNHPRSGAQGRLDRHARSKGSQMRVVD